MASEIEAAPCKMKLVERSYFTPPGWRLATLQEAKNEVEMIKQQGLLKGHERGRLLDGWISGPHYNIQMGDEFRSCLGHMLIIQLQPSASYSSSNSDHVKSIYGDVTVSPKGRQVALFLCTEDWNYEVVYWVLNYWEKRETFNSQDVREGKIPFSNNTKFVEMNRLICDMGRILGEEGFAGQKAAKRQFSTDSVEEVMVSMGNSCWDKLSLEHKKILGQRFQRRIDGLIRNIGRQCSEVNWFQKFASEGGTSGAIWNFLWFYLSSSIVVGMIGGRIDFLIKELWGNEECQTKSRKDFWISTAILFHLSKYKYYEIESILQQACKDSADDRQHINDTLQNPESAYYDETGDYHVLNKILVYAVWGEDRFVVNKVLEWGAQPQANLGPDRHNMALYYAMLFENKEIVRSLFDKCHSKEQLANAANEEGKTALHWACQLADLSMCEMVLEYGGSPYVPDKEGRLPLHYAVERGNEGIVDVLTGGGDSDTVQSQDVSKVSPKKAEMITCRDNDRVSPLDIAVKKYNVKLMGKLLSLSQEPLETYFDGMDSAMLLRMFAYQGNLDAVKKLLERGADPLACDGKGRTALHHASMCEHHYNAPKLAELILSKCTSEEERKKWVEKKDDDGKTALHFAAMKGHEHLCYKFFDINRDILQMKDTYGRVVLYDMVEGNHNDDPSIVRYFLRMDKVHVESIVDQSGLTLLHVAVSDGRMHIADILLKASNKPKIYVRTPDVLGQTALHKAAKGGHADMIKVLLYWGANPLLERDCDGRTVFHYFAQTLLTGEDGISVAELLLKKCGSDEKKLLLLWTSAAGLGTADQHLSDSPLRNFLLQQKNYFTEKVGKENNLLRTAACLGDIEMTKELLSRGAQIVDIKDLKWREGLILKDKNNVVTVCQQIQSIAEQGNDQPTTSDNLGRSDFAHGLAALLLNPYLKPPITVGISGSWGMGKSSLMVQTEGILLKTAAQLALLPSEMTNSSFPGFQILEHTEKGKRKYHQIKTSIDSLVYNTKLENNFFQSMKNNIVEFCMKIKNIIPGKTTKEGDSLRNFLKKYDPKYHHIFKSLAAMDISGMFKVKSQQSQSEIDSSTKESVVSYVLCSPLKRKAQQSESEIDSPREGGVPAILTVRYNAWKYRNESEALAGMAVEITKGMEGIMTEGQWLSTCLRNTWRKQKQAIWIEIIFPCLLAVLLGIMFTWILWLLLDKYKIKESQELKYASFPLTLVIMVWTLVKKVMSTVNPVSVQLMNYIKFPDHTEKLGYQERVISDITFLKDEISKKPSCLCTAASYTWHFITGSWIISLLSSKYSRKTLASSIPSANLRTVVFVDDLDRCQESVILQVLSAINLVLAVCEISVVLGMDKELIQRAILKKYGDKSLKNSKKLADKYLQKIIQLPLDLPDPNEVQSKNFLERQLGVFKIQTDKGHLNSKADEQDDSTPEIETAYRALFPAFEYEIEWDYDYPYLNFSRLVGRDPSVQDASNPEAREGQPETETPENTVIDIGRPNGTNGSSSLQTTTKIKAPPQSDATKDINNIEYFWNQLRNLFCIHNKIKGPPQSDIAEDASSEKEGPPQSNKTKVDQSFNELIPIRELLFVRYSDRERDAFCHFQKLATDFRKLPREWKRFLNYHRLVWYIFLINNEAKDVDGWQVQLITWIFICWEFEDNINILVQRWNTIGVLREPISKEPPLRVIVEHCINNEKWITGNNKAEKIVGTCSGIDASNLMTVVKEKNDKLEEKILMELDALKKQVDSPKKEMKEEVKVQINSLKKERNDEMKEQMDSLKNEMKEEMKEQVDAYKKEIKDEMNEQINALKKERNDEMKEQMDSLKNEMKEEIKEQVDALKKEIKDEMKEQMDSLKREIKDEIKQRMDSQPVSKSEKMDEEKKLKLQSWRRLKYALRKYDVSMDGIQAFQRFRFYCEAGHLPWPLPPKEEENENS